MKLPEFNNDLKTTLSGAALAGLILTQVDVIKLGQGDTFQLVLIAAAALVAMTGWLINKADPPKAA